jgi:hypothetical protein
MKVWVIPESKESLPAKVLAEGKGNMKQVMGEKGGSYKYRHGVTSYRKKDSNSYEHFPSFI